MSKVGQGLDIMHIPRMDQHIHQCQSLSDRSTETVASRLCREFQGPTLESAGGGTMLVKRVCSTTLRVQVQELGN